MISAYYRLTKPGIIYGNAIVAGSAFIFGSHAAIDWVKLFFTLLGLSLVVAGACVFNNYYDRSIDARMERTKDRAIVTGKVSAMNAIIFGLVLFVTGVLILHTFSTLLALASALLGFVVYVFMYTPLKLRSGLAVFVGAVAGATPPVVGYTAAGNGLDMFAGLLFAFMFLWQIPHFFAIARYRYDDYFAAGVPLLVSKPVSDAARKQARKIFRYSLLCLLVFCAVLILQRWMI